MVARLNRICQCHFRYFADDVLVVMVEQRHTIRINAYISHLYIQQTHLAFEFPFSSEFEQSNFVEYIEYKYKWHANISYIMVKSIRVLDSKRITRQQTYTRPRAHRKTDITKRRKQLVYGTVGFFSLSFVCVIFFSVIVGFFSLVFSTPLLKLHHYRFLAVPFLSPFALSNNYSYCQVKVNTMILESFGWRNSVDCLDDLRARPRNKLIKQQSTISNRSGKIVNLYLG